MERSILLERLDQRLSSAQLAELLIAVDLLESGADVTLHSKAFKAKAAMAEGSVDESTE